MLPWILVLAGGGGTRLWPMSRRRQPKQFLPLCAGGETLLQATVRRLLPIAPIERILIVTAAPQVDEVRRNLPTLPAANIVVEPTARNTAPCIGLGALAVLARDPDGVIAVVPSDQYVADEARFHVAMQHAVDAAAGGAVVTIGIRPTRPETGYGYIRRGPTHAAEQGEICDVESFTEKPDAKTAREYLLSGDYLWNAGMFFFPAQRIVDEIRAQMPALGKILDNIAADPSRTKELYPTSPATSIDYGVMEGLPRRSGMLVVPGDFGWSDVGSWEGLGDLRPADEQGNIVVGESLKIDARRNVIVSDKKLIAVIGVEDLVIVASGNAVLVAPRARAQDVRRLVALLENSNDDTYL